jgi:hypothetical protein
MMNEEKRIRLDSVNRIELFALLLAAALKKSENSY